MFLSGVLALLVLSQPDGNFVCSDNRSSFPFLSHHYSRLPAFLLCRLIVPMQLNCLQWVSTLQLQPL